MKVEMSARTKVEWKELPKGVKMDERKAFLMDVRRVYSRAWRKAWMTAERKA